MNKPYALKTSKQILKTSKSGMPGITHLAVEAQDLHQQGAILENHLETMFLRDHSVSYLQRVAPQNSQTNPHRS
jgi:hypothetical protein